MVLVASETAPRHHTMSSLSRGSLSPVLLRASIRERVAKRARFRVSSGRHCHTSELTAGAATKKRPSQCRGRRCCPWASFRPWFSSWGHRSSSSTRPSMARYVYPIPAYFLLMTERRFGVRDAESCREGFQSVYEGLTTSDFGCFHCVDDFAALCTAEASQTRCMGPGYGREGCAVEGRVCEISTSKLQYLKIPHHVKDLVLSHCCLTCICVVVNHSGIRITALWLRERHT